MPLYLRTVRGVSIVCCNIGINTIVYHIGVITGDCCQTYARSYVFILNERSSSTLSCYSTINFNLVLNNFIRVSIKPVSQYV